MGRTETRARFRRIPGRGMPLTVVAAMTVLVGSRSIRKEKIGREQNANQRIAHGIFMAEAIFKAQFLVERHDIRLLRIRHRATIGTPGESDKRFLLQRFSRQTLTLGGANVYRNALEMVLNGGERFGLPAVATRFGKVQVAQKLDLGIGQRIFVFGAGEIELWVGDRSRLRPLINERTPSAYAPARTQPDRSPATSGSVFRWSPSLSIKSISGVSSRK